MMCYTFIICNLGPFWKSLLVRELPNKNCCYDCALMVTSRPLQRGSPRLPASLVSPSASPKPRPCIRKLQARQLFRLPLPSMAPNWRQSTTSGTSGASYQPTGPSTKKSKPESARLAKPSDACFLMCCMNNRNVRLPTKIKEYWQSRCPHQLPVQLWVMDTTEDTLSSLNVFTCDRCGQSRVSIGRIGCPTWMFWTGLAWSV